MLKMLDKPLGLLISVAGGIAAGAVFNRVWTLTTGQDDAPEATDPDRSWREVLSPPAYRAPCSDWSKPRAPGWNRRFPQITGTWPDK